MFKHAIPYMTGCAWKSLIRYSSMLVASGITVMASTESTREH